MLMCDLVLKSFAQLEQYCRKERFQGWDAYDGLNSKLFQALPILPKKRLARLMWIQFIKKMPVNLRPLLGIEKGLNPKRLALFISGYCRRQDVQGYRDHCVETVRMLADQVISLRTPGYSGNCWGYNF